MVKLLVGEGLRPMLNHNTKLWISNYGRIFNFEFSQLIEINSLLVRKTARIEILDEFHNIYIDVEVNKLMKYYWPEPLAFTILQDELKKTLENARSNH